jgi:hypothetical protein
MLDLRGAETLKGVKTHNGGTFWARKKIFLRYILYYFGVDFLSFHLTF